MKNYEPLTDYYSNSYDLYLKIWGQHLHYGLFRKAADIATVSLNDAGVHYSKELVTLCLSALPLYRRRKGDFTILELCCGRFPTNQFFSEYIGGRYFGVDIVPSAIEHCKNTYNNYSHPFSYTTKKNLATNFINTSIEEYLTEACKNKECFDAVICQDSFYHIINKEQVIKLIHELLKPGGILILSDLAVDKSSKNDSDFSKYFVMRQAQSNPLTFQEVNGRTEYEYETILSQNDFYVKSRIDHTQSLCLSYQKAFQNLERNNHTADSRNTGQYDFLEQSFKFLSKAAKHRKLRLLWWLAAKRTNTSSNNSGKDALMTVKVNTDGFNYTVSDKESALNIGPILDEMELSVKEGEYIGLVGKTGIGKTTLLNGIMGYLNSNIRTTFMKENLRITMVHQEPLLWDDFTVKQAVGLVLKSKAKNCYRQCFFDNDYNVIMDFNLIEVENQLLRKLSRGQKQRVAIALALSASPDILLLDEPFASQDYVQKTNLINIFKKVKQRMKFSVIHVTHIWDEVSELADSYYEISCGQLIHIPKDSIQSTQITTVQ